MTALSFLIRSGAVVPEKPLPDLKLSKLKSIYKIAIMKIAGLNAVRSLVLY